ncbi:MAG: DNA polymerase I, partial [Thalassospira sp.]|nr:DNA polymerase I [Thalassospira sp.]
MTRPLYLIDVSGYIFRAYHALPPMTAPDGTPVNAVVGFCNMLFKLQQTMPMGRVIAVFDKARKTFRSEIYPAYKAHRPPAPDDLIPQFDLVREAVDAFGMARVEQEGFEADDILASYAAAGHGDVVIVSSDKDLYQLLDTGVRLYDPMKNKQIGDAEVFEKFGVAANRVADVQALMGDASDNVPGVPGIGAKTAAELINEYGSLEALLSRAAEIKQNKRRETLMENAEKARISYQLVLLRRDVALPIAANDAPLFQPNAETLRPFFERLGFKALLAKLGTRHEARDASRDEIAEISSSTTTLTSASPSSLAPFTVETILTESQLAAWVASIRLWRRMVFDLETTGLNPRDDSIVGIALAVEPGKACYIPLRFTPTELGQEAATLVPESTVFAALLPLLRDESILKIGHNLKFDLQFLEGVRVEGSGMPHASPLTPSSPIPPYADTMLMSYALNGAQHGHSMDELSSLYLGHSPISFDSVTNKGKLTFDQVPLETATQYAAEDAAVTLALWQLFSARLGERRAATVYQDIELPLMPILAEMERTGIAVDPARLKALSQQFGTGLEGLEREITALAGHSFNIASPKQLGVVLFDELGLPGGKKSKTGQYKTDSDVLESLAAQGFTIAEKVLSWRGLAKLKSTYTDALQHEISPKTGRIHTHFLQTVTTTGRLSCAAPNLQNIPIRSAEGREIRSAFIAKSGCILISLDYSQIELRLLAHCANLPEMQAAFASGRDIHMETAKTVFGEGNADTRRRAKAVNFGIIYGISAFGLAAQLGIPQRDAQQVIDRYFAAYPGIRQYMDTTIAFARKHGYVETLFGRTVWTATINDKNGGLRQFAERAAINAPLQGTAADVIKRAMPRVVAALRAKGFAAQLILQVHDELIL